MFENSLKLVADAGLSFLHVFSLQPARGHTRRAHAAAGAHGGEETRRPPARDGRGGAAAPSAGLWWDGKSRCSRKRTGLGRTPCFTPVAFAGDAAPGTIVTARITGLADGALTAELVA